MHKSLAFAFLLLSLDQAFSGNSVQHRPNETVVHSPGDIRVEATHTNLIVDHPVLIVQRAPILVHKPAALISSSMVRRTAIAPPPPPPVFRTVKRVQRLVKQPPPPPLNPSPSPPPPSHRSRPIVVPRMSRLSRKQLRPLRRDIIDSRGTNGERTPQTVVAVQQRLQSQQASSEDNNGDDGETSMVVEAHPDDEPPGDVVDFDENERNEYVLDERMLDPRHLYIEAVYLP